MKRKLTIALIAVALPALALPLSASAAFGLDEQDVLLTDNTGAPSLQAGSHPYQETFVTNITTEFNPLAGGQYPTGDAKDVVVSLPPGLVGEPTAVPRCTSVDFLLVANLGGDPECSDSTALGTATIEFGEEGHIETFPLYNLYPAPGSVAKLGFVVLGRAPVFIDLNVNPQRPHNIVASVTNISQTVGFYGSVLRIWGTPADPSHDDDRGSCLRAGTGCSVNVEPRPFLTLPTRCDGALQTVVHADSWQEPGIWSERTVFTHDDGNPPFPLAPYGCAKLGFSPTIEAEPTSKAASSPTGLDFTLNVDDEGLTNPGGIADSTIKKTEVTLPEGFTTNPAIAEGLEVCSEAQLAAETPTSAPGAGCPEASKIGTVEVESELIEEPVNGALFLAKPYENPFNSLLAMYIVARNPTLGIIVRQPLHVIPDPKTGQLTTVAEDMPQLPFSHFRLHFREGTRSPLASPSKCGTHQVKATMYPQSGGAPITSTSSFEVISGPDGRPCPSGGLPPFRPDLEAGTINNRAGSFSPFNLRLSRNDSEQEITHFSIKLPPGVTGKLSGVPFCPDAAVEAAKLRTGTEEELAPSCPAASEIGRTLVGAGVGPSPAFAPGKLYLAGPYNGSALSMVAITAAKVGPFDLGTVVIRQAFRVDPITAEIFVDATGSDPIPHIIDGIPVHARDIRAYVDRPQFVLNPTSCEPTSTASTVLGSGLNFASAIDDNPIVVSTPFQAADCAALPFKPRISLRLKGGTRRGAFPRLIARVNMNGIGEAGIARARVTLPRSAFLEQGHIRTVCTRVQYAQDACPAASIYGYAEAVTPLLDEPLNGPVYLRSSEHQLPDLVAALKNGQIEIDLIGRVDSLNGRLRNTFESTPDAPVSSVTLGLQGGDKGLIVNSRNLCVNRKSNRAIAEFDGHNGKLHDLRPMMRVDCKAKRGKRRSRR